MYRNFVKKLNQDNTQTEITMILNGSFRYVNENGIPGAYGYCSAKAQSIEFDYYVANGITLSKGDKIIFYMETDQDPYFVERQTTREIPYAWFYVSTLTYYNDNKICHVVGYDSLAKTNIDFSAKLKSLQSSFPMSIDNLITYACGEAGISYNSIPPAILGYDVAGIVLDYFYIDGLTVKQFFNLVGQLGVYVSPSSRNWIDMGINFRGGIGVGAIDTNYWGVSNRYLITPSDDEVYPFPGSASGRNFTNLYYKQGTLSLDEELPKYRGCAFVNSSGNIVAQYEYTGSGAEGDIYYFRGVTLIDYIHQTSANITGLQILLENIWRCLFSGRIIQDYSDTVQRSFSVELFPFRNPYDHPGEVWILDRHEDCIKTICNYIEITDSRVILKGYSPLDGGIGASGTTSSEQALSLDGRVSALERKIDRLTPATAQGIQNSNYITDGNNYSLLTRYGDVVNITGAINPTYTIPAWTTVLTLPSEYCYHTNTFDPPYTATILAVSNAGAVRWLYYNNDGIIQTGGNQLEYGVDWYLSGTWIINR